MKTNSLKSMSLIAVLSAVLMTACQNSKSNNGPAGVIGVNPVGSCVGVNCSYGGGGQGFVAAQGTDGQSILIQLNFLSSNSAALLQQYGGAAYAYYSGPVAYSGVVQFGTSVCGLNLAGQQIPVQPVSAGTYQIGSFNGGAVGANIGGVNLVIQIGSGLLVNPNGTDSGSPTNRFSAPLQISVNGQICGTVSVD